MSESVGSPEGYLTESFWTRIISSGEQTNEYHSLYRIRRAQEKRKLLYQAGRRDRCGGGESGVPAGGFAAMGEAVATAVGSSDGSDAVQRLDLRHAEAVRSQAG